MCELFGLTGKSKIRVNEYLKKLAGHSSAHPNGWGLAVFRNGRANIEKEPIAAFRSRYLKERLRQPIEADLLLAHIRLATKGQVEYANCHPFVMEDQSRREWTLIHNGTIFDCPMLDSYWYVQEGTTDSERILCAVVDRMNRQIEEQGTPPDNESRCRILDRLMCEITRGNNKVNLILFDGELMYVHTNYRDSLYRKTLEDAALFATVPLDGKGWEPVEFTTLLAYEQGEMVFRGTCHGQEYHYNPEDMKYLYLEGM